MGTDEGGGSLLPEASEEELTEDRRYTRSASSAAPVYSLHVGPFVWSVHDAFDEESGVECHWHKIVLHGEWDTAEGESVVNNGLRMLQAWKRHHHPLLLECVLACLLLRLSVTTLPAARCASLDVCAGSNACGSRLAPHSKRLQSSRVFTTSDLTCTCMSILGSLPSAKWPVRC